MKQPLIRLIKSLLFIFSQQLPNQNQQAELGKLSPFLKNTQKSRQLTQSVVVGVSVFKSVIFG
jgi:hypothetical protein